MKKDELKDIIETYNACVKNLDDDKNCKTCEHEYGSKACDDCFNMILGFPVNPTNWKQQTIKEED